MKFEIMHTNINVLDLDRSIAFYTEALGLAEQRRKQAEDGSYTLVFMGDGVTGHEIELTWLADHKEPYDLGENEWHIAFYTDEYEQSYKKHKEMGCVCHENPAMQIYFIEDPDGYWLEIIPRRPRK